MLVNWVESPANFDGVCGHEIIHSSDSARVDPLLGEYNGRLPGMPLVGDVATAAQAFARRLLRDRRFPGVTGAPG